MNISSDHRLITFATTAVIALGLAGCRDRSPQPLAFEPNLVHTMKYQIQKDVSMDQASKDSFWLAETMFGTPLEPKLPAVVTEDEDLASIVSMENLTRASGPADAEGRGLFQKHCVVCHGVSGDGRGPTAAIQMPYPRDYRLGIFKFKSTPRGVKPTKDDIAKLIHNGIGGTAMVKIPDLTDDDVNALVDYVIYLSWRGELERQAVDGAMFDGIIEDGERIINTQFAEQMRSDPAALEALEAAADADEESLSEEMKTKLELFERYQEDWEYAEDYAAEIGESWLEADEDVLEVPEPPSDFPLAENFADVTKFQQSDQADAFAASVKRGQELFVGKVASCSKCHGEKGLGNGQTTDFDDWTKDWTSRVGLKPEDRDSLVPMMARGAFEPRNALPRNFAEGIFRGGSSSEDLYRRITQGIDGTPMPAATFVDGEFEADDVWNIINFIRSLQTPESAAM
ncbi:Cytochrome c [Rubripirellula lacrimiformis]|uniref:Cytochrome c n=1 Tax=Rubripirellula lacrimiformis TaxID=1930273 RepID=A0A517N8A6_9BACT|nr:cytochrome c [Rubripirellula lacrimiformis]QDT03374.1 Cytochrome c [Rubripirellula lacrimiformis]